MVCREFQKLRKTYNLLEKDHKIVGLQEYWKVMAATTATTLSISPSAPDRWVLYNFRIVLILVMSSNAIEKSFENITFPW